MATTQQVKKGLDDRLLVALVSGLSALFLAQLLAGFVLRFRYTPTLEGAHESVQALRNDSAWKLLVDFHYWGSAVLLVLGFLTLAYMVLTGRYVTPYRKLWIGTLGIFGLSYLFQVTGNLLPMDRHDVQTVAIEAGIGARVPVGGAFASKAMLQGDQFGQNTLGAWVLTHVWILAIAGLLLLIWLAPTLLRQVNGKTAALVVLPIAVAFAIGFAAHAPHGSAATAEDYTSFDTLVSWYTWPLHGLMSAAEELSPSLAWIGVAVVPGLFVLLLVALPFVGHRMPRALGTGLFLLFLAVFTVAPLAFGGGFAPVTGNQDPVEVEPPVQQVAITPVDPKLIAEGKKLFGAQGCLDCHSIDGSKSQSGPDLTSIHKEHQDRDWYKKFIKDPKSVKPGSTMPPFPDLLDDELSALADYLRQPR